MQPTETHCQALVSPTNFGMRAAPCSFWAPGVMHVLAEHARFCAANGPLRSGVMLSLSELEGHRTLLLVAWDNSEYVGAIGLRLLDEKSAELRFLHVLERCRGIGSGRMLVAAALDAARQQRASRVIVEIGSTSAYAPAAALYRCVGFRECQTYCEHVPRPGRLLLALKMDRNTTCKVESP